MHVIFPNTHSKCTYSAEMQFAHKLVKWKITVKLVDAALLFNPTGNMNKTIT